MKLQVPVGGLGATATDAFFLLTAAALAVAVVTRRATLRWDPIYWVLLAYFGAMLVSALLAADPGRAALKLATQGLAAMIWPILAVPSGPNRSGSIALTLSALASASPGSMPLFTRR